MVPKKASRFSVRRPRLCDLHLTDEKGYILLKACQPGSRGAEKNFCFFLEMPFLKDYKYYVIDIEILRFSSILFQQSGNRVSSGGTVSYPVKSVHLDRFSKRQFKKGGFES